VIKGCRRNVRNWRPSARSKGHGGLFAVLLDVPRLDEVVPGLAAFNRGRACPLLPRGPVVSRICYSRRACHAVFFVTTIARILQYFRSHVSSQVKTKVRNLAIYLWPAGKNSQGPAQPLVHACLHPVTANVVTVIFITRISLQAWARGLNCGRRAPNGPVEACR
jgi:hypothetical protein